MNNLDFENGMNWESLEKNLSETILKDKKNYKDDRFWTLSRDENDNGAALIRLLPDPTGVPFIQLYSHTLQGWNATDKKKMWYIANSRQTFNEPCPVNDLWASLYNEGSDEAKLEAKNFSRKTQFIANIKVIKDPSNPDNDGKIFLWKFGVKLKDKFMEALNPSETNRKLGEEPKELFNPIKGCNIRLKIKKAGGFLNYDDTIIENPSAIYNSGEEAKNDIISNAYKLDEFTKPENFETYEESKRRLKNFLRYYTPKVLNPDKFNAIVTSVLGDNTPKQEPVVTAPKIVEEKPKVVETQTQTETDDDLSFLDSL